MSRHPAAGIPAKGGWMDDPLVETWAIYNRINVYLYGTIPEAALADAIAPKFRSVGALCAHVHNVR